MAEITESDRQNLEKVFIAEYTPGSTISSFRERSVGLPSVLRIGFFGPTGVGKSALINSMSYAVKGKWEEKAEESSGDDHGAKTKTRDPYFVSKNIAIVDNRGMPSFHGTFLREAGRQIDGECDEGAEVEWKSTLLQRFMNTIRAVFKGDKKDWEIHCIILVVSAVNLTAAKHFEEFIKEMKKLTGEPPIVVVTHSESKDVQEQLLFNFKANMAKSIDWYYELENYTKANHVYDAKKHPLLLKILRQCLTVGDKGMKFKAGACKKENRGNRCLIL